MTGGENMNYAGIGISVFHKAGADGYRSHQSSQAHLLAVSNYAMARESMETACPLNSLRSRLFCLSVDRYTSFLFFYVRYYVLQAGDMTVI
jgi:hypothetical protein